MLPTQMVMTRHLTATQVSVVVAEPSLEGVRLVGLVGVVVAGAVTPTVVAQPNRATRLLLTSVTVGTVAGTEMVTVVPAVAVAELKGAAGRAGNTVALVAGVGPVGQ